MSRTISVFPDYQHHIEKKMRQKNGGSSKKQDVAVETKPAVIEETQNEDTARQFHQIKTVFMNQAESCLLPKPYRGYDSIEFHPDRSGATFILKVPVFKNLTCYYRAMRCSANNTWQIEELEEEESEAWSRKFTENRDRSINQSAAVNESLKPEATHENKVVDQLRQENIDLMRRNADLSSVANEAKAEAKIITDGVGALVNGGCAVVIFILISPLLLAIAGAMGVGLGLFVVLPLIYMFVEWINKKWRGEA